MPFYAVMTEADRRRDPRAEPEDDDDTGPHYVETPFERPLDAPAVPPSTSQVRSVGTAIGVIRRMSDPSFPPPFAKSTVGEASDGGDATDDAPASATSETTSALAATTSVDGIDLARIEHLVDQAQWQALVELLGPAERAATLSPHLELVFAIAHAETHPDDAGHDIEMAIEAAARVCSVPRTSPIARVVAKRLLRRSPTNWRKRPAPPKKISIVLVALALVLGGGGGFWLSMTKVRIPIPGVLVR